MQKGDFRINSLSTRHFLFLVLLFFWSSVQADVSITGLTQSPDPAVLGQTPTYTISVSNPDGSPASVDFTISITGVEVIDITGPADCEFDVNTFFCNTPIPVGGTQSYQFTWNNADVVGDFDVNFYVQCSDTSEGCIGDSRPITTSVIAESVSVTAIDTQAAPGDTVSATIAIVDSLPTTIATVNPDGSVTPSTLPAGGGSVDYSLTIPTDAIANEVITDTITITDDQGNATNIPVTVSVVADTVSITEITLSAAPGATETQTFTVANALATTSITTDPNVDSSVSPTSLPPGGGDVSYSITIPATAIANEVITDTITITDEGENVTTIDVSVTVISDTVSVTELTLPETQPGATATGTFTVSNTLATTSITTDPNVESSVSPTSLPAGGGDVSYSITIPDTAIANEVITDTITITDEGENVTTIDVSVTVISDTVSVTELTLEAVPGGNATGTFTVSNALATESITTDPAVDSSVDPTTLSAGGGSVTYSMTVPSTAVDNEVITDTITITDEAEKVTTIAVSVTVSGDFADLPGLTDSEREVAHALDEACAALSATDIQLPTDEVAAKTPAENLLEICNSLDIASIQDQVTAIQQITPKQAPAQGTSSVEVSQRQFDNITARMKALRSGATGVSVAGLSLDYEGKALPLNLIVSAARQSGGSAGEGSTALLGRLGFFLNGNLSFGDKDGSSNELGFDFDTKGLTAGLDYRFTDQFIVGGSLGYVGSDTEFDSSRGDMDVKGYTLAVYSTYYHSQSSYLDGIISYGWNDFDSSRKVSFLSFNEEASGDTDGTELSISLGGGYDFNRNGLSFGPFGRINYISADIDSYTENTSTGLELVYDDQEVESLTTQLGGQISYAISTSRGVFTPQLRLEWAHEFMDDSRFIEARFLHDPTNTSFRLATDDPDRDYFNLGAGVSATFGAGKSGYLYLETMLGQEDVKQYSLAAGFRLEF